MTGFTLRPLRAADFEAWLPLWHAFARANGSDGTPPVDAAVTAATWARFLDPTQALTALVAADAGGEIIGFVHTTLYHDSLSVEPVCYLEDLFTAEKARRQGVARALVAAACEDARARGAAQVFWVVPADNAPAQALYDRIAERAAFIVYGKEV